MSSPDGGESPRDQLGRGPSGGPDAFGAGYHLTPVDRLGVWLSARRLHHEVGTFAGKRIGDFGCGFHATFVRSILDEVASAVLVDVSLADDLKTHPKIRAIEGRLPTAMRDLPDASLDVALCTSVLEHLTEPFETLCELRRLLAPGGTCVVNVPSWRGKRFLELSAFRLGTSPPDSIDDHKTYYDPRDLWPLLVRAGFRPRRIKCRRHKFGLNTFAACRIDPQP
jgi:SAM-dependent methyltransferase